MGDGVCIPKQKLFHVAFLHPKLRQTREDLYIVDIAAALQRWGHFCTIYTSEFDDENAIEAVHPMKGSIDVVISGQWLPNSIFGFSKRTMSRLKALWQTVRIIVNPPNPKPTVLVIDTETIVLPILSWFSSYKTIYVQHFPQLHTCHEYYCAMQVTTDLLSLKTLGYAGGIIVQTERLAEIFRRSFPKIQTDLSILYPRYDTGLWAGEPIDIRRILPDLPDKYHLFVCFGAYKSRSNFKLVIRAMECVFNQASLIEKSRIHLIIAGYCSDKSPDQQLHYEELIQETKHKQFAPQLTFLKQLPTIHKKTLIQGCTAVIHTVRHDVFPGPILAAMSLGKPIIALNCGFPPIVLTHRMNGILIDPDPVQIGKVMYKLTSSETLTTFLGDMAYSAYNANHSYANYCKLLNDLVQNQAKHKMVEE